MRYCFTKAIYRPLGDNTFEMNLKALIFCFLLLLIFPLLAYTQPNVIDSLQKVLQTQKGDTNKVNTLAALSYTYRNIDADTGLYYGNKALALAENLKWKKGIAKSYKCIGNNYYSMTNTDKAIEYFEKSLNLNKDLNNNIGIAESLTNIGTVHESLSDYSKALEYFQSALNIFEKANYKSGIGVDLVNLGSLYWDLSNYPKALEYYLRALKVYEQLNEKIGIAKVLGNLGVLYTDLADYSKALEYCKKSLAIHNELGNKFSMGIVLNSIGLIYYNLNDNQKALDYYKQSLSMAEQVGDETGIAQCYSNIGGVYLNLINYVKAFEYAEKGYKKYLLLNNEAGTANCLYNISEIYFQADNSSLIKMGILPKERFSRTVEKLNHSLQIAVKISALDLQRNALEELSIVYEKQNDFAKAYDYYKKFIMARDSVINDSKKKEIIQNQYQYEYDKKEDQIKLLSTQNKLQTALAQQQNQRKNFAYAGIGIIVLAGSYGFYRFRKRKQQQNQQALMNERLRISRELHDEVGATLSGIAMYSHLTKEQIKNANTTEVEKSLNIMQQSAGEMVNKLNDIVWLVNPDQDSLQKLIQRLEEYARDMAAIKNMQVKVNVPEHLQEHILPMESRRNIYLFCKEAINNAVKYSNGTLLDLDIKEIDNKLEFSVSDNGKGFDAVMVRRGNGLENMQKRADEIGARLTLQSKQNEGCLVSMQLKIS